VGIVDFVGIGCQRRLCQNIFNGVCVINVYLKVLKALVEKKIDGREKYN